MAALPYFYMGHEQAAWAALLFTFGEKKTENRTLDLTRLSLTFLPAG